MQALCQPAPHESQADKSDFGCAFIECVYLHDPHQSPRCMFVMVPLGGDRSPKGAGPPFSLTMHLQCQSRGRGTFYDVLEPWSVISPRCSVCERPSEGFSRNLDTVRNIVDRSVLCDASFGASRLICRAGTNHDHTAEVATEEAGISVCEYICLNVPKYTQACVLCRRRSPRDILFEMSVAKAYTTPRGGSH